MEPRHVIISIVDSADMTDYDGVINTERSRRWAKYIDSLSTQTKQPDIVVYCPTSKGEYWDDIKSVALKRMGELEDTTFIFGPSLEGMNTLSVRLFQCFLFLRLDSNYYFLGVIRGSRACRSRDWRRGLWSSMGDHIDLSFPLALALYRNGI